MLFAVVVTPLGCWFACTWNCFYFSLNSFAILRCGHVGARTGKTKQMQEQCITVQWTPKALFKQWESQVLGLRLSHWSCICLFSVYECILSFLVRLFPPFFFLPFSFLRHPPPPCWLQLPAPAQLPPSLPFYTTAVFPYLDMVRYDQHKWHTQVCFM